MKLSELKKGDIFKFGDKFWDTEHRFHSILERNGKPYIMLMSLNYSGDIEKSKWTSYTWRDKDEDVWIPKYFLSEYSKTYGMPCVPHSDQRIIYPSNLNQINLSDVYCSGREYHYNRHSINF